MIKERDLQLDILKGIGIVLVVFAHTYNGGFHEFIYLFHMPLFFFLSGAALNYSKNRIDLMKRFKRIMVPYFVFSLICFIYWVTIEARFRPVHDTSLFSGTIGTLDCRWQQFINIFAAFSFNDSFLYNIVLWFLPCLFVAMILYLALKQWLRRYTIIGIIMITSCVFVFSKIYLPWCTEIAVVALPFIYGGDVLYNKVKNNYLVMGGGNSGLGFLLYLYSPCRHEKPQLR